MTIIPSIEDLEKLNTLRQKTFIQIYECLKEDGHCKRYEGTFGITFPCYFDDEDEWSITLDLYVFGPDRHYTWNGKTLREAIEKADSDVTMWIREWGEDK